MSMQLAVTLLRAAGVPARIASGFMYLEGRYLFHAWVEYYDGMRWISADPTWGQGRADVGHVRFLLGGLERQLALIQIVGNLRLEYKTGVNSRFVENLVKDFGSFRAVNNISFEVHAGEVFGFLGPNGAGKTTSMRMIAVLKPTSGHISIDNYDFNRIQEAKESVRLSQTARIYTKN